MWTVGPYVSVALPCNDSRRHVRPEELQWSCSFPGELVEKTATKYRIQMADTKWKYEYFRKPRFRYDECKWSKNNYFMLKEK